MECLSEFQEALKSVVDMLVDSEAPEKEAVASEYFIGVEGSFGSHHVTPRELSSEFLRSLVC